MSVESPHRAGPVLANLKRLLPDLESLYTDVHAHPELSMQETRTAALAAERLRASGYEVTTGIGKTGVVAVLRHGEGPTVMLRADMDALPVEEATGVPYASKVRANVVLGQHVMVGPAGVLASRTGPVTSAADSLQIRLFGRGAHGSMPQAAIDPVVMAAATVMRLQTIVSRELGAAEAAVVTIGALQAGVKENVIPDEAIIKLNIRTYDENVRKRILASIERIVNAEAAASGAPRPPEITPLDRYPLAVNDPQASARVAAAFRQHFSAARVRETGPTTASEDFGSFGAEWHVPSVFWFVGGIDPEVFAKAKAANRINDIPTNHNPRFLPVIHPTLEAGVEALVVASLAWLPACATATE
jgi:metal-dependent amidase/aminoacylase/carboxypeptidase family protein